MIRRLAVVVTLAVVVGATACTEDLRRHDAPVCDLDIDQKGATSQLMAQAVPSAQFLPCIRGYPNGWAFGELFVRDGKARFSLDHDRAGTDAVTVTLTEHCALDGFDQISSDEDGLDRYERVDDVRPFRSRWLYRFRGGCVVYEFAFPDGDESLVREIGVALGFVTRAQVGQSVEDDYPGEMQL